MTAVDVQARIAMLEARVGVLGAGRARAGGRVGSGMQQALAAAAAAATGTPGTAPTATGSPTTLGVAVGAASPSPAGPTSGRAVPDVEVSPPGGAVGSPPGGAVGSPPGGAVPAWVDRLPAAGASFAPAIAAAAQDHGLDERLLAALVWTESAFDPGARSPAGAIGLGQLMPGTAAELGVDPHVPEENLDGAARYLRTQLDRFGDLRLALAAYNAGPGRVAAAGGVPAIEETTTYVARVTGRYATLGG